MKFQTISLVAGDKRCNAGCPFCIAKQTSGIGNDPAAINMQNLGIALELAKSSGVTTALITGKGEPTLFIRHVWTYIVEARRHGIPLIELQTNGLKILDDDFSHNLVKWRQEGLSTIAISIVHYEDDRNGEVYRKDYPSLANTIQFVKKLGYSVRLNCIGLNGYIDSPEKLEALLKFAGLFKDDGRPLQVTWRPVMAGHLPKRSKARKVARLYHVPDVMTQAIMHYAEKNGTKLLALPHGAMVYDFHGQNLCLTNCLTRTTDSEQVRQLIFCPNGAVMYDWEFTGAIIL